jgi:hypothetical protein
LEKKSVVPNAIQLNRFVLHVAEVTEELQKLGESLNKVVSDIIANKVTEGLTVRYYN